MTIGNDVSAKRRAFFLILEVSHDFPIGSWNFWPQVRSPDAACVLKREMNCHLQHSGFKTPETASVVHSTQWAAQWAIVAIVWDVINW